MPSLNPFSGGWADPVEMGLFERYLSMAIVVGVVLCCLIPGAGGGRSIAVLIIVPMMLAVDFR